MPDATSPQGTADDTTLSFDQGVDDITELLEDPSTDLSDEDQGQTAEAETDAADETAPEEAEASDEEGDVTAQEADGSGEIKGGRFAPDTAKVTLEDGTVITVAELKRNNLFQRDYTRKTQEISEEKKSFEAQRQQVGEYASTLNAQRDFLLQAAQHFLPKPPDRAMIDTDVFGYQHALADYQEKMGIVNQLQQYATAEQARAMQEREAQTGELIKTEAKKLKERMPELAQKANYDRFMDEAADTMAEYGFTPQELAEAFDHRFYLAMRDLVKYRKARQQAPKVQQDMQAKPKLMPGGKRMDPKAKNSREQQVRSERLRKTGSLQAGIDALMDLDL